MQIQAYLYSNIVQVQFWDLAIFTPRNRVVYSRPITVYQGIDNPLQIVVRNQDQKLIDLTGYSLQVNIEDPLNEITAYTFAVEFTDITKGLGTVVFDRDTVNSLEQRIYKLTIKRVHQEDDRETPVYVDDNFTVPIDLIVKPAYYSTTEAAPLLNETVIDSGTLP